MNAPARPDAEPSSSPLQAYYAARAAEYDAVYSKPERQDDLRLIEAWLPPRFNGRRVLELACGTGHWTRFLAPVAASVFAIDSAEETLAIARTRVHASHVEFAVGDAYAPGRSRRETGRPQDGKDDAACDAAFAGFWLSHVPLERLHAFLAALDAALAPGALVVFLDNRYVAGSSSPISERDALGNTYQSRPLADGSTHRVLKNFPSEAQLLALVEGSARHASRYTCWPHYWAFEYRTGAA